MSLQARTAVALIAFTVFAAAAETAVAAPADDGAVVPGETINGIALRQTKASVWASTPLGFADPRHSVKSETPIGKVLTEIWLNPEESGLEGPPGPRSFAVTYFPAKTMKIKGKRRKPRVVHISTGQGFWVIESNLIHYASDGSTRSTPADVADFYQCSFYSESSDGRDYTPTYTDAQRCELLLGPLNYFYFTFNHIGPGAEVPAGLAAFTMSKFQIN